MSNGINYKHYCPMVIAASVTALLPEGILFFMICRKCQSQNINLEYREDRQQYSSRCKDCGQFTWQPKEGTKNRESKHSDIIKKIGIDYCEWCLRNRIDIPPPGTLEAHHIIEYKDGGTSEQNNILILCTACHKQCHHDRTYYSHYKNSK